MGRGRGVGLTALRLRLISMSRAKESWKSSGPLARIKLIAPPACLIDAFSSIPTIACIDVGRVGKSRDYLLTSQIASKTVAHNVSDALAFSGFSRHLRRLWSACPYSFWQLMKSFFLFEKCAVCARYIDSTERSRIVELPTRRGISDMNVPYATRLQSVDRSNSSNWQKQDASLFEEERGKLRTSGVCKAGSTPW